uniref:Uncharacterized protein n=1 Tax=Stegastes partitus TaxID=144197 RepID=A0A3B5BCF7_9TELE
PGRSRPALIHMHKIFSVQGSNPVVRAALRARGWVELRNNRSTQQAQQHCHKSRGSSNGASDNDGGKLQVFQLLLLIMIHSPQIHFSLVIPQSRQVKNEMVYFYWTYCREAINTKSLHKEQITNHFADSRCFTTKVGLCMNLRNLHWFDSTDPDTFFPRCYILGAHEKQDFIAEKSSFCYVCSSGHDLHPWLLEINASPDMSPSTPVTARLCAAVQEDTLKVVLDWRVDHTANTGDFELIYRQVRNSLPSS